MSGVTRPRLGFVGLGWIGAMRMRAVVEAGAAEAAALCDPAPANLETAREAAPGAPCFAELDGLLAHAEDLGLDGLVIATPNALHAPQTLAALSRGLAVFCQKPMALDATEAGAMVEAARAADRLLGVDYSYRHTDGARALCRLIRDGGLGRVFSLSAVFHNAYGPDKAWCRDPALAGGGALVDLGVHLVDLALWLLGRPAVVGVAGAAFAGGEPLSGRGIDDFASARIELDGGAVADLAVSWNAHAGQDCIIRVSVFGTGGGAELRNVGGSFYDFELARFAGRSTEVVTAESRDWLGRGIVDWARRLAASPRFDAEVEASVEVARVVDAIYGAERVAAGSPSRQSYSM